MAQGSSSSNIKVVPHAYQALNQFKYEVANELGINPEYKTGYWGNISSRECGSVGGHMVRRMIALAEQELSGDSRSRHQPEHHISLILEEEAPLRCFLFLSRQTANGHFRHTGFER